MEAVTAVEDEVRELVRRRGLDPVGDRAGLRRLIAEVIKEYDERALGGGLPQLADAPTAARQVYDAVAASDRCSATSTTQPSRRSGSAIDCRMGSGGGSRTSLSALP